jgi:septal ring factor EnvC (AmiA/AmiB activator)
MENQKKMRRLFVFMAALGMLVAGGCASNGTLSTQKISLADKAISEAKGSNASLNAPSELKAAEEKLARARAASSKEDYKEAVLLAEQASSDAEYARTKATTEKARKTNEEMRKNIEALRQEIERLSKP